MKLKILLPLFIFSLVVPFYVSATNSVLGSATSGKEGNELISCKAIALQKKNKSMNSLKSDYQSKLSTIADRYRKQQEKANWLVRSSYIAESKKIENELSKETLYTADSYKKSVNSYYMTWKVEDALCEHLHKKATTTQKSSIKMKK